MQINPIMQNQNYKTTFQAKVNLRIPQNKIPFTKEEISKIKEAGKKADTFKKVTVNVSEEVADNITENCGIVYDQYTGSLRFFCKRPDNSQHTFSTEYTRIEPGTTKRQFIAEQIVKFLNSFSE